MNIKKTLKDNWMIAIIFPLSFCIPMSFATAFALGYGYEPLLSVNQLFLWLGIAVVVCICLGLYTFYKLFSASSDVVDENSSEEKQ
jgi:type VI protein secretion system component VasK